jgi:sugar phosphate isomerase/epimerase
MSGRDPETIGRDPLARCSISELTTKAWSFEEDVAGYSAAGWGAIGVWLPKLEVPPFAGGYLPSARLDDAIVQRAARAVRGAGLRVSHLVGSGLWTLPAPDGPRQLAHTAFAIEAAAALNAECLIVVPGPRLGRSLAECTDIAARALDTILDQRAAPVRLAIEPLRPSQVDCFNNIGEVLDLVELVGSPDLGILFDTWHLWRSPTLLEDIERAGERIFGVHLADAAVHDDGVSDTVRLVPGDGVIPFAEILSALEATGYAGWYEIELEQPPSIPGGYAALLATCADRLRHLLARHVNSGFAARAAGG